MSACISFRTTVFGCLLGLAASTGHAQIVINELAYDDTGADDEEFVELFNAGESDVDLTGWYLATGDGTGPGPEYGLPDGAVLQANGYLVLGSPLVPGVDVVLATPDLFGDGPSYIILMDADEAIADRIVYESNKGLAGFPEEAIAEGAIWGNHVLVTNTKMSWQRWFDGRDTERNDMDFGHLPWTPGASNDRTNAPSFSSDFEDGIPELDMAEFPGSFVPARIIDPESMSLSNPNGIPQSPDGGLALIAWDPVGGGNFAVLEAQPAADMMFEAWVYFDGNPELPDEIEAWSIGLRGTSGTFYNFPILYEANGNTGVTWTFLVTSSGGMLYLVDEGYGEPAAERVHLGVIPIVPGENDGWQRLRLEVQGDRVRGHFGGTYGATDDGVQIDGTLREVGLGNFYIGYREALSANPLTRPPTIDSLVVDVSGIAGPRFQRGNADALADVNITDGIFILNFLFLGGAEPPCMDAADADDSGALNISDGIAIFNFLFLGGGAPETPGPFLCGPDPTADDMDCALFENCP